MGSATEPAIGSKKGKVWCSNRRGKELEGKNDEAPHKMENGLAQICRVIPVMK